MRLTIALILALTLLLASGLQGCAEPSASGRAIGTPRDRIVADVSQISAVPGRSVIVAVRSSRPLAETGDEAPVWIPNHIPEVRAGDGTPLRANLIRFQAGPAQEAPQRWLAPASTWEAHPWEEVRLLESPPTGPGFWGLMIDLTRAPGARRVVIDGLPTPVRWIAPPSSMTDLARAPRLSASGPALERLGAMLAHESIDAIRRWRVGVVGERFRHESLWPSGSPARERDAALEALAQHLEDRWRAALDEAARIDRRLGSELLCTLTAVIQSPDGELLPAWPANDRETLRLLDALLSSALEDPAKQRAIEQWLAQHPAALAWIIDDAGADDDDEGDRPARRLVTVGVSELRGQSIAASIAPVGEAARTPARLLGHRSLVTPIGVPMSRNSRNGVVMARIGAGSLALGVLPESARVAPPGSILGPFTPQHTMMTWRAGSIGSIDARWATVASLARSTEGAWRLYVECNTGGSAPSAGDEVRIWFGPRPATEPIVVGPGKDTGDVSIGTTHWSALVELPPRAIDESETIRLGLIRIVPGGARQSWPRPLTPGQTEPGKAVLDLSAWGSLRDSEDRAGS